MKLRTVESLLTSEKLGGTTSTGDTSEERAVAATVGLLRDKRDKSSTSLGITLVLDLEAALAPSPFLSSIFIPHCCQENDLTDERQK